MEDRIIWPGWVTTRLIGRGSASSVYEIQRENAGQTEYAAMKVISIPQNPSQIDGYISEGYDRESIAEFFLNQRNHVLAKYAQMKKTNGAANILCCEDVCYAQHEDGIGWDVFVKMELLTPIMKALPEVIPEETVIRVALDLCSALEVCQQHGVVHRDVKPQNIFVSTDGVFKLGDFGSPKAADKAKTGSNHCIAPEVYHNHTYSSSADIYALGMVLYWLLNAHRMPFLPLPPAQIKIGMHEEARARRLSGEALPLPQNGSEALQKIVLKACAFSVEERYSDASEMKRDLEALLQAVPVVPETVEEVPVVVPAAAEEAVYVQPEEPVAFAEPVYAPAPAAPVYAPTPAAPVAPVYAAPVQKKKGKKTGIVVAAIVLVLLLAVGAYFFLKPAGNAPAGEVPEETVPVEDPWVQVAAYVVEEGGERLNKEFAYDSEGNLVKTTSYSANGEITGWSESEYDDKGNKIKHIWYNRDGMVQEWYTYGYDADGNETKGYCYNADDTLRSWYTYEFDSYGNWTKYVSHGSDGAIVSTYSNAYEYDSNGKLTKQSSLDKKGNVTGWGEYDYDSSGNQAKYTWFLTDGTISAWRKYAYDADGNMLLNEKHLPDGSVAEKMVYEYDTHGNLIGTISYNADGNVVQQMRYEYRKLSEVNG